MSEEKKRQTTKASPEGMTFEKGKKPRDRSWDKKHNYQVASYRIDPDTKKAVLELAKDLKVSSGDLADFLLNYGIEAYRQGDLKIDRQPKKYDIKAG